MKVVNNLILIADEGKSIVRCGSKPTTVITMLSLAKDELIEMYEEIDINNIIVGDGLIADVERKLQS